MCAKRLGLPSTVNAFVRKVLRSLSKDNSFDAHGYWRERARKYGKRAVLNLAYPEDSFDQITERQKKILFPVFSSLLNNSEKSVLDFGCGPGRFTSDIANLIHGSAVGLDISEELLAMAPRASNVRYGLVSDGLIKADGVKFDVIWICLVLGGIPDNAINATAEELERTLNPGGLLFLVENTSRKVSAQYWIFRSVEQYQALFPSVDLRYIATYCDVGEDISIIAGRKKP